MIAFIIALNWDGVCERIRSKSTKLVALRQNFCESKRKEEKIQFVNYMALSLPLMTGYRKQA